MDYYLLQSIVAAPFIEMKLVATSTADYNADPSLNTNPLVVDENNLPVFIDGIATKKVENGAIINTPAGELTAAATANAEVITTEEAAVAETKRAEKYIDYPTESATSTFTKFHNAKTVKVGGTGTTTLDDLPDGFWCAVQLTSAGTVTFDSPNGSIKGLTTLSVVDDEVFIQHLGADVYLIR